MSETHSLGCGRCGYPIAGLDEPVCPECGSDFRDVGVQRRTHRSFSWLIGACAIAAIVVFIASNIVGTLVADSTLVDDWIRGRSMNWIDWLWIGTTALTWILTCLFCYRRWMRSRIHNFDQAMLRYPI